MTEFPAAHSMDTTWFAVDADGNVGLFDSREDGAVPTRAATLGGAAEPSFDALVFYAAVAARRMAAGTWEPLAHPAADRERVMVVRAEPPDDVELFDVVSPASPWIGLSKKPVKPDRIAALAGTAGVKVVTAGALRDGVDELVEVFAFDRDHGDDPGKYQRTTVPTAPLRVDELPAPARDAIGSLRLAAPFAASPELHLADHLADADAFYYGEDWTLRGFGTPPPPVVATARRVPPTLVWLVIVAIGILAALLAR